VSADDAATYGVVLTVPIKPWGINQERQASRWTRAGLTRDARNAAYLVARAALGALEKPAYDRVGIVVCPFVGAGHRGPLLDLGNCYPAAKACIDGFVQAKLIADDTDRHLGLLTFKPTSRQGTDRMVFLVTDLAEVDEIVAAWEESPDGDE